MVNHNFLGKLACRTLCRSLCGALCQSLCMTFLFLTACAGDTEVPSDDRDPFEPVNRRIFAFNLTLDDYVLEPAAATYRRLPQAVQGSVSRHLAWTSLPSTALNSAVQGKLENAALATFSFTINALSLGFIDLMEGEDQPAPEDFGQTLASAGVGEGPYLMLPFIGSHTGRSVAGWTIDLMTDPFSALRRDEAIETATTPLSILSARARYFDVINDMKQSSLDPYIQARSAYYQRRHALLRDNIDHAIEEEDSAFDSFFDQ